MRTKPSSTAHQRGSSSKFEVLRPIQQRDAEPIGSDGPIVAVGMTTHTLQPAPVRGLLALRRVASPSATYGTAEDDEGLLHDARNLINTVGLYCDLLSMPDVLRPEHRHYSGEIRMLGERSVAMIERLIDRRLLRSSELLSLANRRQSDRPEATLPIYRELDQAEGLRLSIERCAGLLGRIANKHAVEIVYGEAAALPVRVPAESIERILINLVCNATSALTGMQGSIRITAGLLFGDGGDKMRPWPFQRVRMTVEDTGRGMTQEEVERLLEGRAPHTARHGIGFRVVRELIEVSGGELAIFSRPGCGTRIEMEWPIAQPGTTGSSGSSFSSERRQEVEKR